MKRWVPAITLCLAVSGCGFAVQSPDLFLLRRTGPGSPLTLLVNDVGIVHCNGGTARQLSDPMLLEARQAATDLDQDAQAKLRVPPRSGSVYSYTIKLQNGTVSFADTAGAKHPELARAELFATQAAQHPCGLTG
jgi:hypothetical protein